MKNTKPTYEELKKKLTEAEELIAKMRRGETNTARGERNAAEEQRNIAVGERDTARGQRNTAKSELDTAIDQRDIAKGERDTSRDERDTAVWETKELTEAYIASEQNFKNSMDASPLGIRIVTENGDLIYANRAILDICGFNTAQEMAAVPRDKLYTPESFQAHLERKRKRKLKEFVPTEYEISIKRTDGQIRILQVFRREVMWGGEKQFMAMYQDITEHKRAEEALKESEEKFHSIVEHGNDGIVFIQNGTIQYCNSKTLEISGYTQREIMGKPFIDFVAPEDKKMVLDIYTKRIEGKKARERYEFNLLGKGGRIINAEVSASLVTFKQEQVDIVIIRDITERKQMEDALRTSEEKFHQIFQQGPLGIVLSDLDFHITMVNDQWCKMLGYTEQELRSMTFKDFSFPEDTKISESNMQKLVKGELAYYQQEKRSIRKNKEIIWENLTVTLLRDKSGKPLGLLAMIEDITQRKQMEEALRASEERFRQIFQQGPLGIVLSDLNYHVTIVNDRLCKMLGYTEQELRSMTFKDFSFTEEAEISESNMQKLIKGELSYYQQEKRSIKKNKDIIWESLTVTLLRDKSGKPLGLLSMIEDITQHKIAEVALKESEEKFNKVYHASLNLMAVISLDDGKIIDVNEAYCKATGYDRDELIGRTALELNLWANLEQRDEFYQLINKKGMLADKEILLRTKSGDIRTFLFSAEKITLRGISCLVLGALDITERKQAEERINYLNQTLRSIRNVNQLITREKDRDKLLKGVCDTLVESRSFYSAWIALFDSSNKVTSHAESGISNGFIAGFEEFQKGNLPPCVQKAMKKKGVIITKDHKMSCVGCPLSAPKNNAGSMTASLEYAGNFYGVLGAALPKEILTDENEVSLFNEVASDIAFALYNMEREAEYEILEQEHLRAAKLESIGTLAGGIAHDFNNLLTGIMGNIGLVKMYVAPSDDTYDMLDEAEKAAVRAKDLTQQLLTFARGGKPVKKAVDIATIIRESAGFALRGSRAKLELILPEDLWPVEADEGQISQVINNLVINADEAMPLGGTLKIRAENRTLKKTDIPLLPSGNYLCIHISDTGIGMSPENLQRIFEPYFTTKQRGSGLGLTTAYSIVRNHGGTILTDSVLNHGSHFHIYLPAAMTKKATKGGKKIKATNASQVGGKILVMDDEEIIRKMLQNMLNLGGYTVELSADGAEALEKYQQAQKTGDPFGAVIMDLTIPGGMGGKEAVKKLLEIDPQAKVIVSSGYANDPIMSEYKKYGFKAVIAKPYSVKQLQEAISNLLTNK